MSCPEVSVRFVQLKLSSCSIINDSESLLLQTLTVTPVLTTKTLPLVLKAAATTALPGSVLPQRPPTVAMVTTAITKPDSQNTPINLQVASKLTNQSSEPVRLVSKNAMVVRPPFPAAEHHPPLPPV